MRPVVRPVGARRGDGVVRLRPGVHKDQPPPGRDPGERRDKERPLRARPHELRRGAVTVLDQPDLRADLDDERHEGAARKVADHGAEYRAPEGRHREAVRHVRLEPPHAVVKARVADRIQKEALDQRLRDNVPAHLGPRVDGKLGDGVLHAKKFFLVEEAKLQQLGADVGDHVLDSRPTRIAARHGRRRRRRRCGGDVGARLTVGRRLHQGRVRFHWGVGQVREVAGKGGTHVVPDDARAE